MANKAALDALRKVNLEKEVWSKKGLEILERLYVDDHMTPKEILAWTRDDRNKKEVTKAGLDRLSNARQVTQKVAFLGLAKKRRAIDEQVEILMRAERRKEIEDESLDLAQEATEVAIHKVREVKERQKKGDQVEGKEVTMAIAALKNARAIAHAASGVGVSEARQNNLIINQQNNNITVGPHGKLKFNPFLNRPKDFDEIIDLEDEAVKKEEENEDE